MVASKFLAFCCNCGMQRQNQTFEIKILQDEYWSKKDYNVKTIEL